MCIAGTGFKLRPEVLRGKKASVCASNEPAAGDTLLACSDN
jgi:hypothetical protein